MVKIRKRGEIGGENPWVFMGGSVLCMSVILRDVGKGAFELRNSVQGRRDGGEGGGGRE